MWARSIAAFFLSFPASAAILALVLLVLPWPIETKSLPVLLMFFPLWVGLACGAFMIKTTWQSSAVMILITCVGFGTLYAVKYLGWATL